MIIRNQDWTCKLKNLKDFKPKNPVLIEGLPGIGNVAKIAVDYLIQELNAKVLASFVSYKMPHSVYVNPKGFLDAPNIELYYAKVKNDKLKSIKNNKSKTREFLFLTGDTQPLNEESCHSFCELVSIIAKKFKVRELITFGGIGLDRIPSKPNIYSTSVDDFKDSFKNQGVNTNMYGKVGPIIGVAGLLPVKSFNNGIKSACLLAETYNHPLFLGVNSSIKLINVLAQRYSLAINLKPISKEARHINKDFKALQEAESMEMETLDNPEAGKRTKYASYIG